MNPYDVGPVKGMWCAWIGIAIGSVGILAGIDALTIVGAIVFLPLAVAVSLVFD